MIALLLALVTVGSPPCYQGVISWQIEYADGVVEEYATTGAELTFEPRPYRDWRLRSQNASGWSDWGAWHEVPHYPGDINGNCIVSGAEVNEAASRFGETCP